MKWIGQHIWDFISRFRSDVYLEDLTESAQGHVVGIDADGKLYKQDVSTGDMTGVDISVGPGLDISQSNTTSGNYASTINLDLTEVGFGGGANRVITDDGDGTVTAESTFTYDGLGQVAVESAGNNQPSLQFLSSNTGPTGPEMSFNKTVPGAPGDLLGSLYFNGQDVPGNNTNYGQMYFGIQGATHGKEAGVMNVNITTTGGGVSASRNAFAATGSTTANKVNTEIGYGASSDCTIAGDLHVMGGRVDLRNTGELYFYDNDNSHSTRLLHSTASDNRTITLPNADGTVALTSDIQAARETFHFNKRITVSGSSTTTWYGGYPDNSYISGAIYNLDTTKSGDNYTDTNGRGWTVHRYTNFMVASNATVKKFILCGVEQSGVSTDITVAIWKVSPTIDAANQSTDSAVVDFIGEIELTADASDTTRLHAPPAVLTSFQSGASLSAGDGIMLAARKTGGDTDGTYWYVRGAIEVEYD